MKARRIGEANDRLIAWWEDNGARGEIVNLKRLSSRCRPPDTTAMHPPLRVQMLESAVDYSHEGRSEF